MDTKSIIKNLGLVLLCLYIIIGSGLQIYSYSQFKSLPSPIYGGDYYFQMGMVNHIRYGGNPLESNAIVGTVPGYLPLYSYLCAVFCNILNLDTIKGMLYFSIIIFIVSSIIWYILFKTLFENEYIAIIGVILTNGINYYPILKYTPFTLHVMIPLFILFLYLSYRNKDIKYYIPLGIIYGLMAISHTVAFVGATLIILTLMAYEFYKNKDDLKNYLMEHIKNWGLMWIVGLSISMLYWYKPIFKYHLYRPYDRIHMDTWDFGRLDIQLSFLFDEIVKYLFNFSSISGIIITVLTWIGLYGIYKGNDTNKDLLNFLKVFGLGAIISVFSYFITEPILHINFIPSYMESFYLWTLSIIIALYGLRYAVNNLKNTIKSTDNNGNNNEINKNVKSVNNINNIFNKKIIVLLLIFLILSINSIMAFNTYVSSDRWAQVAKNPLPPEYQSLQKYIIKNTNVNDVILSTKELSFAVNSLTGRKIMVCRWAQLNNPYIPVYQRDMDAAVILYGNNTNKKLELLRKYNVSYLFWHYNWINTEYKIDRNGRLLGIFDPLMTYDTEKNRRYLSHYNVKYSPMYFWVDPACRSDKIRKYHLLLISPYNYYAYTHPWHPDLDRYLVEVWNYSINGYKVAALYKINYSS